MVVVADKSDDKSPSKVRHDPMYMEMSCFLCALAIY